MTLKILTAIYLIARIKEKADFKGFKTKNQSLSSALEGYITLGVSRKLTIRHGI
jgi:hypothetical protein